MKRLPDLAQQARMCWSMISGDRRAAIDQMHCFRTGLPGIIETEGFEERRTTTVPAIQALEATARVCP